MSTSQKPSASCSSPAFKKPKMKVKLDADGKKRSPLQDVNASQGQREAKDGDFSSAKSFEGHADISDCCTV